MGVIKGLVLLFRFYFKNMLLVHKLPIQLKSPQVLMETLFNHEKETNNKTPYTIEIDSRIAVTYREEIEKLKTEMRNLGLISNSFEINIIFLFLIRFLGFLLAIQGKVIEGLLLQLLQFFVAPFSLFSAVSTFIALFPPLFIANYTIQIITITFLPLLPFPFNLSWANFEITNSFIFLFFVVDQIICLGCAFSTGFGESHWCGWKKLTKHFLFGLISVKTYTMIILLAGRGVKFNLAIWVLDYWFGWTKKGTAFIQKKLQTHWAILFYQQHRMAHLPIVYEHAHKFHHYFHDTSPFDGHIYGSGMPEEFFMLWFESIGAMYGLLPTSINGFTLLISLANKVGHTRVENGSGGINHHPDHHTQHIKNFSSSSCIIDMYFGTSYPSNDEYEYGHFNVVKKNIGKNKDGYDIYRFEYLPGKGRSLYELDDCCFKFSFFQGSTKRFSELFSSKKIQ